MNEKWYSRKLAVIAGSVALAFFSMWAPAEARKEFLSFLQWAIPTYVAGQSAVDYAERAQGKNTPPDKE